jgi:menaquinone-9 beta-reductase
MADTRRFDVAIVGASIAGCCAAILFGRAGLKVALIERKADIASHKQVCTTFIQASALPTIERLGIAEEIERAGAVRNGAEFWTPWGWIRRTRDSETDRYASHGYSLKRSTLDPILKQAALRAPGVEIMLGGIVRDVRRQDGRVSGLAVTMPEGEVAVEASLVVAADGRMSSMADMIGAKTVRKPNNRFVVYAFYRNLPLATGDRSQFWALDPDMAFAYPFPDKETMLCCFVSRERLQEWRADTERCLLDFFRDLPQGPDLSRAERVSDFSAMYKMDNIRRPAAQQGMAFVGDAAIAADPMSGVGCGWAMQAAEWLVDATEDALRTGRGLDRALASYAATHRRRLWPHEYFISDNSTGRSMNALERMISIAAANDQRVANRLHLFTARQIGVGRFLRADTLARVAAANIRHLWRERRSGKRVQTRTT